jgi:hypothetical protein
MASFFSANTSKQMRTKSSWQILIMYVEKQKLGFIVFLNVLLLVCSYVAHVIP